MLGRLLTILKAWMLQIYFLWFICYCLNALTFLVLFYKIRPGNSIRALHYNVLVGVEWYGKGTNLYLIPIAAFLICSVNFILFKSLKKRPELLASLTVFISLCVQLIFLSSILFLASVN
jgi:hypothetical protein